MTSPHPLAPTGRLRAAINTGSPVLARPGADGGAPAGVSVDLARMLGERLGLPVDLVAFASARAVNEALDADAWDVAFMAADPERAGRIAFTAPYLEIEAGYVVRADAPVRSCADLDRSGLRIAAGNKAAYEPHAAPRRPRAGARPGGGAAALRRPWPRRRGGRPRGARRLRGGPSRPPRPAGPVHGHRAVHGGATRAGGGFGFGHRSVYP